MSVRPAFGHKADPVEDFYEEVRQIHGATLALDTSQPGAHVLIRRAAFAHTYAAIVFRQDDDGHMSRVLALLNRLIDYLADARDAERKREFDSHYGPELAAHLLWHDSKTRREIAMLDHLSDLPRAPSPHEAQRARDAKLFRLALATIVVVMIATAVFKGYMRGRGL
jgi:hypothetical protein